MNPERKQSRWAALLLIGFILAGLGGFGTWYYGSNPAGVKETNATAGDHQPIAAPSPALAQKSEPAKAEPVKTPAIIAAAPQATPVPVTSQPSPSSTPDPTVSKPDTAWNLDDKQRQKIVASLRKYAGKSITISCVESDKEGAAFAGTLKGMFEEAGWQVDGVKHDAYAKPPAGLNLVTGSFPYAPSLVTTYESFTSAGFKVSQQLDARLTGGQAELIVGAKQ